MGTDPIFLIWRSTARARGPLAIQNRGQSPISVNRASAVPFCVYAETASPGASPRGHSPDPARQQSMRLLCGGQRSSTVSPSLERTVQEIHVCGARILPDAQSRALAADAGYRAGLCGIDEGARSALRSILQPALQKERHA